MKKLEVETRRDSEKLEEQGERKNLNKGKIEDKIYSRA